MSWTIATWDSVSGTGSIRSPHFDPIPFSRAANVHSITDFQPGETVLVKLAGSAPHFVVEQIIPTHQRQPLGTEVELFRAINGQYSDLRIEDQTADRLELWVGDCCDYCTRNAPRLVFEGVTTDQLSPALVSDNAEFEGPWFRAATAEEISMNRLDVPLGSTAYCVVSSHGNGPDGPRFFIVAKRVTLTT